MVVDGWIRRQATAETKRGEAGVALARVEGELAMGGRAGARAMAVGGTAILGGNQVRAWGYLPSWPCLPGRSLPRGGEDGGRVGRVRTGVAVSADAAGTPGRSRLRHILLQSCCVGMGRRGRPRVSGFGSAIGRAVMGLDAMPARVVGKVGSE